MDGITKFKKIENLGVFENFSWPSEPEDLTFKKINLLYGFNGSGKTTLSNVVSLFSEDCDDVRQTELLTSLSSDSSKDPAFQIEWDGKTVKSVSEKKKVFVFNSAFISDHVYDGTKSNIKSFKEGIVTEEQLSNPAIKELDEKIKSDTRELDKANEVLADIEKHAKKIKKDLSQKWNEEIQGTRMPQGLDMNNCPQKPPVKSIQDIEAALEKEFEKFRISKDQSALENDISALNQTQILAIKLPQNLHETLNKSVSREAKEKTQEKIEKLKQCTLGHGTIQNWFEDGARLLKYSKEEATCPLCESKLDHMEDLISSYDSFFNQELSLYLQALQDVLVTIGTAFDQLESAQQGAATIQEIISKYEASNLINEEQRLVLKEILSGNIRQDLSIARELFSDKKNDVSRSFSDEEQKKIDNLAQKLNGYNRSIEKLIVLKSELIKKLQESVFDVGNAREICKKLFWKKLEIEGTDLEKKYGKDSDNKAANDVGGIVFYNQLRETVKILTDAIEEAQTKKSVELAKLKNESKYVNGFLSKLCVSNFTIDTDKKGEIQILYTGKPPKKGIRFSLSEGEKTTLAFAYFLSKYRYEVVENQDASVKVDDYIIVIDDPVSSLDENRLFSTALVIQQSLLPQAEKIGSGENKSYNWSGCNQIFVFSHNLIFLKFLSNIIETNQNSSRADFYLEKGQLQKLPAIFQNYQSCYFYKLAKVQSFVDGDAPYESVRDCLPNYIRIVLEVIISFKCARLRGPNNNFQLPTLDALIGNMSQYDFSRFPSAGSITDKSTLLAALNEIKNRVNPESHGSVQDITHIEYLPETELRKLAQQSIEVIQFLDQMHYQAVQNLQSAA